MAGKLLPLIALLLAFSGGVNGRVHILGPNHWPAAHRRARLGTCNTQLKDWDQCGPGKEYAGACCPAGWDCQVVKDYYSQCQKLNDTEHYRHVLESASWGEAKHVMVTVANAAATLHTLKPFVNSLADLGAGLETSLVVVALDQTAYANCQAMHQPHLCIMNSDGSEAPQGTLTNWSPEYYEAGWTRAVWTQKAVQLGFTVLMVDLDLVWFKNPYRYMETQKEAHVLATDDCLWDPLRPHNQTGKMANLGVVMFRQGPMALKLLEQWMTMRGKEWDQWAFRVALMDVMRDEKDFRPHIMGVELFVNLCCQYCTADDWDVHQMQMSDIHQCFDDEVSDIYIVHVACTRGETIIESKGHLLTMLLNYRRAARQQPAMQSIRRLYEEA